MMQRMVWVALHLSKPAFIPLLVSSISGESGRGKRWQAYRKQFFQTEKSQCLTTGDIKAFLDSKGVTYESFELPSQLDITECFIEGDEKGELQLDFLTEVLEFSKMAPPELKAGALELLRHPDGKVIFNSNLEALVLDQLNNSHCMDWKMQALKKKYLIQSNLIPRLGVLCTVR